MSENCHEPENCTKCSGMQIGFKLVILFNGLLFGTLLALYGYIGSVRDKVIKVETQLEERNNKPIKDAMP